MHAIPLDIFLAKLDVVILPHIGALAVIEQG
jgi:hypothetical protein